MFFVYSITYAVNFINQVKKEKVMKYQITFKATGEVAKFRANDWQSFDSEISYILNYVYAHNAPESDYEIMVDGQVVSLDLAQKAATFARKAWEFKRAETKKPIRVSQGATCLPNTYKTVWINK